MLDAGSDERGALLRIVGATDGAGLGGAFDSVGLCKAEALVVFERSARLDD